MEQSLKWKLFELEPWSPEIFFKIPMSSSSAPIQPQEQLVHPVLGNTSSTAPLPQPTTLPSPPPQTSSLTTNQNASFFKSSEPSMCRPPDATFTVQAPRSGQTFLIDIFDPHPEQQPSEHPTLSFVQELVIMFYAGKYTRDIMSAKRTKDVQFLSLSLDQIRKLALINHLEDIHAHDRVHASHRIQILRTGVQTSSKELDMVEFIDKVVNQWEVVDEDAFYAPDLKSMTLEQLDQWWFFRLAPIAELEDIGHDNNVMNEESPQYSPRKVKCFDPSGHSLEEIQKAFQLLYEETQQKARERKDENIRKESQQQVTKEMPATIVKEPSTPRSPVQVQTVKQSETFKKENASIKEPVAIQPIVQSAHVRSPPSPHPSLPPLLPKKPSPVQVIPFAPSTTMTNPSSTTSTSISINIGNEEDESAAESGPVEEEDRLAMRQLLSNSDESAERLSPSSSHKRASSINTLSPTSSSHNKSIRSRASTSAEHKKEPPSISK